MQKDFLISTSFSNSGPASPPVPPIIEQGPSDPGETDPVPAKVKFSDSGSKGTVNGQNSVGGRWSGTLKCPQDSQRGLELPLTG